METCDRKMSALCRSVTKDGCVLEILIYDDDEGQWMLEVANDANGFTGWLESFETEQQALDEALRTIEECGIEEFYERQPWREH